MSISVLLLALLHVFTAQECIRAETHTATVIVNWCSQPVTATLSEPIGHCINVGCKSSHRKYVPLEEVNWGKQICNYSAQSVLLHACSMLQGKGEYH